MGGEGRGPQSGATGFTLGLAVVDAIPVLEFSASMICVALRFQSFLFVLGALCCVLAGCGKVAWKLVLALRGRDIPQLAAHFMPRMLTGFALMVAGLVLDGGAIDFSALLARILAFPAVVFFAVALLSIVALCVLRSVLDQRAARSNWIEQFVNISLQTALLIGICLC